MLASCATDTTVILWNLHELKAVKTLNGHEHEVSSVQFLVGGDYLFSASRDCTIKMWDITSGFCVHTLKGH